MDKALLEATVTALAASGKGIEQSLRI